MTGEMQSLYSSFLNAFENNDVSSFFENENYLILWPTLEDDNMIPDLITGTNRIIKHTNTSNGVDYFLIGLATESNAQIFESPIGTIYVNN